MEGDLVQLAEGEQELTRKIGTLMDNGKYNQAIPHIKKLIKIRDTYALTYLWLGDCYRNLGQFDEALDSYNKALEFDGKCYDIVDDNFRKVVTKYINGIELMEKAMRSYYAKQYKKAIHWSNEVIKIDANWGDIYALRGHCNEFLGNRILAIKDYSLSLNLNLSESLRLVVEELIKPKTVQSLKLTTDNVGCIKENIAGDNISVLMHEYFKFLQLIEEWLSISPEIVESPRFNRFCTDIDKLRKVTICNPGKAILIGMNKGGMFFPNQEELMSKMQKYPDTQYLCTAIVEDTEQLKEVTISLNLGKRLALKDIPKSESKLKELERKRRYYYRHKFKLSGKQNDRDEKRKAQIHFKNKFYYLLRKSGISKTYMMKDVKSKSTEDSVYHQLSNE